MDVSLDVMVPLRRMGIIVIFFRFILLGLWLGWGWVMGDIFSGRQERFRASTSPIGADGIFVTSRVPLLNHKEIATKNRKN